jgi:hypothetical protein
MHLRAGCDALGPDSDRMPPEPQRKHMRTLSPAEHDPEVHVIQGPSWLLLPLQRLLGH